MPCCSAETAETIEAKCWLCGESYSWLVADLNLKVQEALQQVKAVHNPEHIFTFVLTLTCPSCIHNKTEEVKQRSQEACGAVITIFERDAD